MSGGVRTFKLASGGYADVPEEKIDEWMQRMDQRGIQFQTADVSADMQVGEPEAIKPLHDAPAPQPSMLDRFLDGGKDALQTGADTLRGGLRGATMGYGDKLEAGARSLFSGRPYADEFADQNAMVDAAEQRSPIGFNAAKTLMGAPYDIGAAVLGAPGGLAGEVASSAALGELRGAGMSRSPTLEGMTEDAARGAGESALWGAGGNILGRFLKAGSGALSDLAPKARASAMGEIGPAARAMRKSKGDEFVENLPQAADELGMTPQVPMDWQHPIDSIARKLSFNKPGDYADEAQRLMDDVHGPAKGEAVRQATAQGVSVPREDVISSMGDAMSSQPRNYKRAPYEAAMERNMQDVPNGLYSPGAPDQLNASQLDQMKMDWAKGGYKDADAIQTMSEAVPARASRDASNIAGTHLGNAMDEMALPETAQAYHSSNDAFEKAASIGNMAREKQLGIDTQSPFSLPNIGRVLGGAAGGATVGGQVAGMPGAVVGGIGGVLGNKAVQNYGPDVLADFLRAGPSKLHPSTPPSAWSPNSAIPQQLPFGAPGGGMRDASLGAAVGGVAAGPAGAVGGAVLGGLGQPGVKAASMAGQNVYGSRDRGMPSSDMTSRFMAERSSPKDSLEQGRGYALTDAVMDALRNDPQSLGPYASQFGQAMGAGSNQPDAIGSLITRLSKTDANFRTQILPALRARTGGMQ
jgi:hypothetical protein